MDRKQIEERGYFLLCKCRCKEIIGPIFYRDEHWLRPDSSTVPEENLKREVSEHTGTVQYIKASVKQL